MKKQSLKRNGNSKKPSRRLDRAAVTVFNSFKKADQHDREYWWSRTPAERLAELERLRQLNYGFGSGKPRPRFQRVVKVAKLRRS